LCLWLQQLGADVTGVSYGEPSAQDLFALASVGEGMKESEADVRDAAAIADAIALAQPEVVIHMAAQSLVRRSYEAPAETFAVNVIGTANVLEAVRRHGGVRSLIVVTSDKCYENTGLDRPFTEDDPLGGDDPYSCSKACAELLAASYRRSFFTDPDGPRLATARAGNVIGAGDRAPDRLIPDLMRAVRSGTPVRIRNPGAVRPWQHVLNPLCGYLLLAEALWQDAAAAAPWNFGPPLQDAKPVSWLLERLARLWPGGFRWTIDERPQPHEARTLRLDSTRARAQLGWQPVVGLEEALASIVDWHLALERGEDMRAVTLTQLEPRTQGTPMSTATLRPSA
jgi:CDP-glucose 4,6-dehydratase